MIIIGIDPGMDGAFAFLDATGTLLDIVDMPCDRIEVGRSTKFRGKKRSAKTERRVVSPRAVLDLLESFKGHNAIAFMERLVAMPGRVNPLTGKKPVMGATSMLSFGRGGGIIETALTANLISLTFIGAATWKKAVGCPTGKDSARARAAQQFPAFATQFKRVSDDGRAESALIALYGSRVLAGAYEAHSAKLVAAK